MADKKTLYIVTANVDATFLLALLDRELQPVVKADPRARVSFFVRGFTGDELVEQSPEDVPSFTAALKSCDRLDRVDMELGRWSAETRARIKFDAYSYKLSVELHDLDQQGLQTRARAFESDPQLFEISPTANDIQNETYGYADLPMTLPAVTTALRSLGEDLSVPDFELTLHLRTQTKLSRKIAVAEIDQLLQEHWPKLVEIEIEFQSRGVRPDVEIILPRARVRIQHWSLPNHPNAKRLIDAIKTHLKVDIRPWDPAFPYRSGTLTYRLGKPDARTLKLGLESTIAMFAARSKTPDETLRLRDPDVDRAFVTYGALRSGFGPVEELKPLSSVEQFLDELDAPQGTPVSAGLFLIGSRDRTFNLNIDFRNKGMSAWSTEELDFLLEMMKPVALKTNSELIDQPSGGSDPGKNTGILPTIATIGGIGWRWIAGLLGTSAAALLAALGIVFESHLEFSHPVASGETFVLSEPGEIYLDWDQSWGLFSGVWRPPFMDPVNLSVDLTLFHNGDLLARIENRDEAFEHAFQEPGLYRIDVDVDDRHRSSILIDVKSGDDDG
ncbi:MAG: hypothetical protein AAFN27_15055 [Pseudomonadota bacterium]